MADDVRTNIKITADDSAARKLNDTLEKTFDQRRVRKLNDSFEQSLKLLEKLDRQTAQRQILDLKAMKESLRVELESRRIKSAEGLEASRQKRAEYADEDRRQRKDVQFRRQKWSEEDRQRRIVSQEQAQQARQEARVHQRRGFIGGFSEGIGLSNYLPSEPGQGARMAGTVAGRTLRMFGRGVHHASMPFLQPGIGGVMQALSSIPLVGGGMSGALGTAAGTYQQALGFDRSRWHALSMMSPGWGRQYQIKGTGGADFTQKQKEAQRLGGEIDRLRAHADELRGRLRGTQVRRTDDDQIITEYPGAPPGAQLAVDPTKLPGSPVVPSTARQRRELHERQRAGAQNLALADARLKTLAARQATIGSEIKASGPRFGVVSGLPGMAEGIPYGIGPQQMMGMFTEMMGARGGTYDRKARGQFREMMAAGARFGISPQQAGAFARLNMAGGGGRENRQLSEILQSSVAQGLDGSQIAESLQTLVQLGQQAEQMGMKIDPQSFTRTSGLLGLAGLQGLQAPRVAGGLHGAAVDVSRRGVSGPMDVLLARAAGFNPDQGPEGYAHAKRVLAKGATPTLVNSLLSMLTKGVQGSGFGPEMQSDMFRSAMGRMGVQIGYDQADDFLKTYKSGGPKDVEALWARGEAKGARKALMTEAKTRVGIGAGLTKTAAGLETEQIDVGYKAAGFVTGAELNQLKAALVMTSQFGKGLEQLNAVVGKTIASFDKLLSTIGAGPGFTKLLGYFAGPPTGKR